MLNNRVQTPWGLAQTVKVIDIGIFQYGTATHGGYYLDEANNAKVPQFIKDATFGMLGRQGWYEEDEDWAYVVLLFPSSFDHRKNQLAADFVRLHTPEIWAKLERLL